MTLGNGKYYTYASGAVYDGNLKDGRRHGNGKLNHGSGNVYDGNYKDVNFYYLF